MHPQRRNGFGAQQQQHRATGAGGPLVPPPGLGAAQEDKMMPVKVPISEPAPPGLSQLLPQAPLLGGGAVKDNMVGTPYYTHTPCNTSGEWVNAVLATAPYLDAQGLQQALQILDCAIGNVQQAKVLEGIMTNAQQQQGVASPSPAMPHLFAVEFMRMQVSEQQQQLIRRLHELRAAAAANGAVAKSQIWGACGATPATVSAALGGMDQGGRGSLAAGGAPSDSQLAACREALAANLARYMNQGQGQPRGCNTTNAVTEANLGRPAPFERQRSAEAHSDGGEKPAKSMSRQARAPQSRSYGGGGGDGKVQTLSTSLQLLSSEDPDCLFIVRRINKLGFKAARKLKQHFSTYGSVVRVLVAHSTVRQHGDPQSHARRRPSSLGFVHMASAEAVRQVLAVGLEQEVDGSLIRVQRFERQHASMEGFEEGEDDEQESAQASTADKWSRQQSAVSTFSAYSAVSYATTASAGSSDGKATWPSPTSSSSQDPPCAAEEDLDRCE